MTMQGLQDRVDLRYGEAPPLPPVLVQALERRTPRIHLLALFLMVVATVLWGLTNVVQKMSLEHLGPFTVVAARCWLGALILIPLALRERRQMSGAPFRVLSYYNILAAAAFSIGLALQQISSGLTTATNMGFLVNSCAVAVPLILWLTGSGFPGGRVWIAAAAVMTGAALLSGFSTKFGSGDLLCLASAFSYAVWTIAVGRAVTGNGAASTLTLFQLVICGVLSTSAALSLETPTLCQLWDFGPGLLYLGLCGTGIAFALSAHAQRFLPICAAAIIMNLEALFTAVFGHLILGEILGGTALLGGLMILGGCISVQIRR